MSTRINVPKWLEKYNRWQIKVRKDGDRKTFLSYIPGRKGQVECQKKADAWLSGIVNPTIKVNKLYSMFLEDCKDRTSTGNYTNMESIGRVWILPKIGFKKISSLTEQDLQNILNAAHKKGKSHKTISNVRGALTSFLRFARKSRVTELRADDLVIPNNAPIGERKILNTDALKILFSSTKTTFQKKAVEDWYVYAYRFLAIVGLRPGELCELQRKKQDSKSTINIHGSFNRFGEHTSGKTKNALREFILPEAAVNILKDQEEMLKRAGIVSAYLFPAKDGTQSTSRELYKRWKMYQKINGIEDISLYELRHTFVSVCKGTLPESIIKPVVGHSSKMPTYNTYGHQIDGDLESAALLIDKAYKDILK